MSAGVYPVVAERLAREPWVSLEMVEAWIGALRRQPHVRQLGGVLAAILRKPETCLPPPCPVGTGLKPVPTPLPPDEDPPTQKPSEDAPAEDHPPCDLLWEQVLALLRQRLGEERVKVWLSGSAPLAIAEGRLIVALRSPFGVDWVQNRYYRDIQAAIEEVTGRSFRLRFILAGNEG